MIAKNVQMIQKIALTGNPATDVVPTTPTPATPYLPYTTMIAHSHDMTQLMLPYPRVVEFFSSLKRTITQKAPASSPHTDTSINSKMDIHE